MGLFDLRVVWDWYRVGLHEFDILVGTLNSTVQNQVSVSITLFQMTGFYVRVPL